MRVSCSSTSCTIMPCYHNQIVREEMSSWTALTCHIWVKGAFYIWKANIFGLLTQKLKVLRVIAENAFLKKYSTLQQGSHKIRFQCHSMLICIFVYYHNKFVLYIYVWFKVLSKLSNTSPHPYPTTQE